jgi:hypothetical protein
MRCHSLVPMMVGLALTALVACNTSPTETSSPAGRRLLLIVPQSVTLAGGRTVQLKVSVRDAGGQQTSPGSVNWFTTSSLIADIASNGTVTGRQDGTADIVAEWDGLRAVAKVTVTSAGVDPGCPEFAARGSGGSTSGKAVCATK